MSGLRHVGRLKILAAATSSRIASAADGVDDRSDSHRVERFLEEVPALQKLKLVFGLELKGRGDIQLSGRGARSEDHQGPRSGRAGPGRDRPRAVQRAVESGTVKSYRKAWDTGHIKVVGDANVKKLIAQVIERQEQRARLKKVH